MNTRKMTDFERESATATDDPTANWPCSECGMTKKHWNHAGGNSKGHFFHMREAVLDKAVIEVLRDTPTWLRIAAVLRTAEKPMTSQEIAHQIGCYVSRVYSGIGTLCKRGLCVGFVGREQIQQRVGSPYVGEVTRWWRTCELESLVT